MRDQFWVWFTGGFKFGIFGFGGIEKFGVFESFGEIDFLLENLGCFGVWVLC
jgi:hypothetical protein